jgi:hypothetical protein
MICHDLLPPCLPDLTPREIFYEVIWRTKSTDESSHTEKKFKEKYRKGNSESSLGIILGEFKPILKVQKGCAMYRDSISCTSYNTGKLILLFLQSDT